MNPRCNNNGSSNGNFFRSWTKICNDSHFTIVSSNCFTYDGFSNTILALRLAESLKKLCAVWVSVGIAMCYVTLTIVMFELNGECQCIVKTATFLLQGILEVTDILSISIPSIALSVIKFSLFLWIKQRFHSLVVWTLWFNQVDNVEFIGSELFDILNLEIKPLSEGSCVVIVFKDQVVFIISNFNSSTQVSRFKSTFKNESVIIIIFLGIKGSKLRVIPVHFRNFLIESRWLAWWTIWIVFPVVDWILFWWQLNEIIIIQIWNYISFSILFYRWDINAIKNNFFTLTLIDNFFSINSSVFFTHCIVEWMNWFKVSAPVLKSWSFSCKRLFNTSSRNLDICLLISTGTASFTSLSSIFLSKQIFEIHIFILC